MKYSVLVIGSKPNSIMPNFFVNKIYTANGAAERAQTYLKKFPQSELTCLVGDLEFKKNINVKERIINAEPNRIIVKGNKINLPDKLKKKCKLEYMNYKNQQKFQSNFFYGGIFSVIYSEFFREIKFNDKLKYILKKLRNFEFQGISTGFFAILKAIDENPNSNILVTGIGMSGGKQFYKNERNKVWDYTGRSRVDRYLVKKFKKKFKNNVYTTDEELFKNGNIQLWK